MSTALLLAGQGTQALGMGRELAAACAGCRATFARADAALDFPLFETMQNGPEETLRRTAIAQPALLALSVAQAEHLRARGLKPAFLAGHSLGQYAALVVAGALDFSDAVRLVRKRGELMQGTVPEGQGRMTTIVSMEREDVEKACAQASAKGTVGIACFNAPGTVVISGSNDAVAAAVAICEDEGAGVVELPVSVPFHSALLTPMVPAFAKLVDATHVSAPKIPVIDNVTARPLSDAASVRRSLVDQVVAPVRFEESVQHILQAGVRHFVQCGMGKGLLGFVRRVDDDTLTQTFDVALAATTEGEHVGPL